MIDNIYIFYGSKSDFNSYINENIAEDDNTIPFMELIQHYNARLRPNESGVGEDALFENLNVDNCVVRSDDYGSVLPHVLANFSSIVGLNYDISNLYIHNPPKRVVSSIRSIYSENVYVFGSKYEAITKGTLKQIYKNLNDHILGQHNCKKQIISALYKLKSELGNKPVVLMLYGPSGVGKTETAKCVSTALGGQLLRVQFSMMQTNEAYDYVFGAEHSKTSLARDLIGRESNVILIDEFDKVNPLFYNAFYELFDEGTFVDPNYDVELKNAIFLCTSNFMSEDEIRRVLGPAMYSRIGACIKYDELSVNDKSVIIDGWYEKILESLMPEEKRVIEDSDIKEWFKNNANRYDNIRILKTKLENAIFDTLTDWLLSN